MTSWLRSSENLLKSHDRIGSSTFQAFFPVAEGLFFRKINCFPVKHKKKNFYFESSQTLERGCSVRLWSHSTTQLYKAEQSALADLALSPGVGLDYLWRYLPASAILPF